MAPPSPASPAAGGSPALTVEGWVKIGSSAGGVLLSVGSQPGLPGGTAPAPPDPCATPSAAQTVCQLALL